METCNQHRVAALVKRHITSADDPASFIESLDNMFFDWVTYPDVCYDTGYRNQVVSHYRDLKELLIKLRELQVVE